jgi:hypothetical protein
MDSYLEELYAHQEWADAEHWQAFEGLPQRSKTRRSASACSIFIMCNTRSSGSQAALLALRD